MSRLCRNYLQVGMYTDVVSPENDVRLIAVNDNVDSDTKEERELAKADAERRVSIEKAKVDIVTLKRRDEDLDMLFKRSYEDMVAGRLTSEGFDRLSADYEAEQKTMRQTIAEPEQLISSDRQEQHDLKRFLQSERKYTDPETLTAELLNDLVDKLVVHAPDKSSGHQKQKIEIHYKAVGIISFADNLCLASHGSLGQKKPRKTA